MHQNRIHFGWLITLLVVIGIVVAALVMTMKEKKETSYTVAENHRVILYAHDKNPRILTEGSHDFAGRGYASAYDVTLGQQTEEFTMRIVNGLIPRYADALNQFRFTRNTFVGEAARIALEETDATPQYVTFRVSYLLDDETLQRLVESSRGEHYLSAVFYNVFEQTYRKVYKEDRPGLAVRAWKKVAGGSVKVDWPKVKADVDQAVTDYLAENFQLKDIEVEVIDVADANIYDENIEVKTAGTEVNVMSTEDSAESVSFLGVLSDNIGKILFMIVMIFAILIIAYLFGWSY